MSERTPKIGDVYMMKFSGSGHEQSGLRPGLTSAIKKLNMPSHVLLRASKYGLRKDSVALCEGPERLAKDKLGFYITTLSNQDMKKIARASMLATAVISFLDPDEILAIWRKSVALNAQSAGAK